MRQLQARQHNNAIVSRVMHSRLFLSVLCVVLFFIVRGTIRVYHNYASASDGLHKVKTDIDILQKRNMELDESLERLKGEDGRDFEIRRKLDVVKPGERVIHVIDESENKR